MENSIVTLIIGLLGGGTLGSIIMYYIKRHDRIGDIETAIERLSEGVVLGLENDTVIFEALRKGHITGESEHQEKKMNEYYHKCTNKGFEI